MFSRNMELLKTCEQQVKSLPNPAFYSESMKKVQSPINGEPNLSENKVKIPALPRVIPQ